MKTMKIKLAKEAKQNNNHAHNKVTKSNNTPDNTPDNTRMR